MPNIDITEVTSNDLSQLQKISRQTFQETFSESNSEEDMKSYLEEELADEKLEKELSDTNSEFYFAMLGEEVIGYLKLNFGEAQTELKGNDSLEIERIYVLKEFHGKNIGQLLYERAIQRAKQEKVAFVWLGVWEENQRAISFYKKNDFIAFDKHIFRLGQDEQTDIMMKLELPSE